MKLISVEEGINMLYAEGNNVNVYFVPKTICPYETESIYTLGNTHVQAIKADKNSVTEAFVADMRMYCVSAILR